MPNPNHPKKDAEIKVDPIKAVKDINTIKKSLKNNQPRDYCLFVLGINTNLRASDLLSITVGQVRDIKAGEELVLKEKKTGKGRRITLNSSAVEAIQHWLRSSQGQTLEVGDSLFKSQRGTLTVPSVNRLVKTWCKEINLPGNYGSHTLRKTFGYHQRTQLNTSIPELMVMFNHSTQRQTLDYLCIQAEEIKDAYMKLSL
ncbi:MAG: site-specific integrase [Desulforhopalus sp.]|nr:site-specific integrase [Desulforhopalus sp.]